MAVSQIHVGCTKRLNILRFPLGSLNVGEKTLVDKAVENFGISIPLLEFHGIRKKCEDSEHEICSPLTNHPYIVTR